MAWYSLSFSLNIFSSSSVWLRMDCKSEVKARLLGEQSLQYAILLKYCGLFHQPLECCQTYLQVSGDGVIGSVGHHKDTVGLTNHAMTSLDLTCMPVRDACSHDGQAQLGVVGVVQLAVGEGGERLQWKLYLKSSFICIQSRLCQSGIKIQVEEICGLKVHVPMCNSGKELQLEREIFDSNG